MAEAPSLKNICLRSLKRTYDTFLSNINAPLQDDKGSHKAKIAAKIVGEYKHVKDLPPPGQKGRRRGEPPAKKARIEDVPEEQGAVELSQSRLPGSSVSDVIADLTLSGNSRMAAPSASSIVQYSGQGARALDLATSQTQTRLALTHFQKQAKPTWHAPWKLKYVIAGHLGSADRTIKLWDLASGQLKITLTGHVATIRHNYLFSCGEDKMVRCWDLEQNKSIRHYHGHLSGVYAIGMHPKLDLLVTGGRDNTCRVWDIRTKGEVHVLKGHTNAVTCLGLQSTDPQVISGSEDTTVRCWDLGMGKAMTTLTNHKRGVRALQLHPTEFTFASASPDNIKKWKFPGGDFISNFSGHNAIINSLALNQENVFVSGADNGTMTFWDWTTGYPFQKIETVVQPGSLESEAGIFASQFDLSGSRLVTCEADKSIKVYQEDMSATPESHPIDTMWKPNKDRNRF